MRRVWRSATPAAPQPLLCITGPWALRTSGPVTAWAHAVPCDSCAFVSLCSLPLGPRPPPHCTVHPQPGSGGQCEKALAFCSLMPTRRTWMSLLGRATAAALGSGPATGHVGNIPKGKRFCWSSCSWGENRPSSSQGRLVYLGGGRGEEGKRRVQDSQGLSFSWRDPPLQQAKPPPPGSQLFPLLPRSQSVIFCVSLRMFVHPHMTENPRQQWLTKGSVLSRKAGVPAQGRSMAA